MIASIFNLVIGVTGVGVLLGIILAVAYKVFMLLTGVHF